MIIYIENHKYDLTEFVNEHPGGAEVFKNGEDLTKEFKKLRNNKNFSDPIYTFGFGYSLKPEPLPNLYRSINSKNWKKNRTRRMYNFILKKNFM